MDVINICLYLKVTYRMFFRMIRVTFLPKYRVKRTKIIDDESFMLHFLTDYHVSDILKIFDHSYNRN